MKSHTSFLVYCMLLVFLAPQISHTCTSFFLDKEDQFLVGKNFDWFAEDCLVIVNKRGISKKAKPEPESLPDLENNFYQPAKWISKYGSITFNPLARELPFSGMNEVGLVVSGVGLRHTEYPAPDSRPSINRLQWIQYQLDNFSTVKEVISSASQLRIRPGPDGFGPHYLVCDGLGDCTIIEYIGGKLVFYTNDTMPVKALSNSTYKESIRYWKDGTLPQINNGLSVERFATAANMLTNYNPKTSKSAIDYAFDILKNVSVGDYTEVEGQKVRTMIATEWSIVYDIKKIRIYFHTFENKKIRYVDLQSFDFSCAKPVKVLDIHIDDSGDISNKFIEYTQQMNRNHIGKAIKKIFFLNFTDDELDKLSRYPDTTICIKK